MKLRFILPTLLIGAVLTLWTTSRASDQETPISPEKKLENSLVAAMKSSAVQQGANAMLAALPKTGAVTKPAQLALPATTYAKKDVFASPALDRFATAPVVSQIDSEIDPNGDYTRLKVVLTTKKYPLIRLEEKRHRDFSTGADSLKQQVAMVADHALIRADAGVSAEEMQNLAGSLGYQVRRMGARGKTFLVSFEGRDPRALENAIAKLSGSRGVTVAEPDFLSRVL